MCNETDECNISINQYFTSVGLAEGALTQNFHRWDYRWDQEIGQERDCQGTEVAQKTGSKIHLLYLQHIYNTGEKRMMMVSYIDKKRA